VGTASTGPVDVEIIDLGARNEPIDAVRPDESAANSIGKARWLAVGNSG
jgi:hypothetical protein